MNQAFLDYYRCPASLANFELESGWSNETRPGYFEFGPGLICYGRLGIDGCEKDSGPFPDVFNQVRIEGSTCILPFNPTDIANNLRYERYMTQVRKPSWKSLTRKAYYALRPLFPISVRRRLQRIWLAGRDRNPFPHWPVDRTVDQMFEQLMLLRLRASPKSGIPFIWFWPESKSSCAIMTHDVETAAGLKFVNELMDINDSFCIKSSFQIIPNGRYAVSRDILLSIQKRGFEVNVHDLKHDGHLFDNHEQFQKFASQINEFGVLFGSKGFRSAILYRNQEWYGALRFSYDMSVPNVGHMDPQRGGCCTVMPYFVGEILEIPVTTTQDYTLFHIFGTYSNDLWREQINQIMRQYGLISFIIHPDYLDTSKSVNAYRKLLSHLSELRSNAELWIALPEEVDSWWRQRNQMRLVLDEHNWRIEGPGSERARVAYATLENDRLAYTFS